MFNLPLPSSGHIYSLTIPSHSNKYLVVGPRWGLTPRLTEWLTDRQSQCDFDFDFDFESQQTKVMQNHDNANVGNIGQGEPRHIKYKRLKLGGGQAYDRSSD
jgi:hypothetical protein